MAFSYRFPPMVEERLDNGLRLLLVRDTLFDVTIASLQIPIGSILDPLGKEGIAEMCLSMMSKGTNSLMSGKLHEVLEQQGAMLSCDVRDDCIIVSVRMLSEKFELIMPLFRDVIMNPAFENSEFKRLKKEMLTGLKTEYSEPSILGQSHFNAELFGKNHPAGRKKQIKSVSSITIDDLISFWHQYIIPDDSILAIASSKSINDISKMANNLFEGWKGAKRKSFLEIVPRLIKKNTIRLINKPELTQTTIVIGHHTINELHPQRVSVALANYIFGGGNFSSRLMKNIRTDNGKTYGILSHLNTTRFYGSFFMTTSTQNEHLENVLDKIFETYNDFMKNGPTALEVNNAKTFAEGNLAFDLEGISNVIDKMLWLYLFNRDKSYIENYNELLKLLSTETVAKVCREIFLHDTFVITAVGNEKKIRPFLEKLGDVKLFNFRADPYK